jgi:hypothetical protein
MSVFKIYENSFKKIVDKNIYSGILIEPLGTPKGFEFDL